MSFGRSAAGRARPVAHTPCPCGRAAFGECCAPVLDGAPAESAESLMRSRYTAYVLRDQVHLARSWHPRTRPDDLALDEATVWTGLTVEEATEGGDTAVVAFRAVWRRGDERGVMTERSRFVRRGGRWVYLDGDVG